MGLLGAGELLKGAECWLCVRSSLRVVLTRFLELMREWGDMGRGMGMVMRNPGSNDDNEDIN